MAPIEFAIACEAWSDARADDQKRDIALAWHVANFAGAAFAGKLKPLHKILGIDISGSNQSAADMGAVLRGIKGGKAA